MTTFKRKILTANLFGELPESVQKYINSKYLIINPDEDIIAYYVPSGIVIEYKNIILFIEL